MFYTTVSFEAASHFCIVGFSKCMYFAAEIQYKNVMVYGWGWCVCVCVWGGGGALEKQERKQECKKTKQKICNITNLL